MHRWIDLFDEETVIQQRLAYLKDRHWIDEQTKEITFTFFVLNAQEEPLVSEAKLSFYFNRGKPLNRLRNDRYDTDDFLFTMDLCFCLI